MGDLGNKEIFSKNLKYYMNLHKKSRNDICKDLNFSYTTFTSWYNGDFYPRIDKIEILANYFNIEKSDLIENHNCKVHERIKSLRDENNLSQVTLSDFLGISRAQYSLYESGKRDIPVEFIIKLAEYYNVSSDYILGKYNHKNTPENLRDKLFILPMFNSVSSENPLLDKKNIEGYLPIDPLMYDLTSSDGLFFLKVSDESMNKIVKNGSYVLIKSQEYAENEDVILAIISENNQAILKKFKRIDEQFIMLEPDSTFPKFEPRIINLKNTKIKIIGKVIGDFKKWN